MAEPCLPFFVERGRDVGDPGGGGGALPLQLRPGAPALIAVGRRAAATVIEA